MNPVSAVVTVEFDLIGDPVAKGSDRAILDPRTGRAVLVQGTDDKHKKRLRAGSKETGGKGNVLRVQKFRGNRLPAVWPDFLHRRFSSTLGATFPWSGHWEDGRDSPAGLARLHLDDTPPDTTEPEPFCHRWSTMTTDPVNS